MLRIFLVDDNAMTRGLIKEALQRHADWVVVGEARDGREALEGFREIKPHLTVMDLMMPEMNGLEASSRLTQQNPDALILMITTDPSNQLEQEAKQVGIRGVCPKDEMRSLVDAIDIVVQGGTYFSASKGFAA